MYLVKELTQASLPEIGRAFGGKHHTTVLHSINKIEQLRHTDADLNRMIHSLIDSFQLDLCRFPQDTPASSGVQSCGELAGPRVLANPAHLVSTGVT